MSSWNMIVDVEKCENCRNCFLAVKDEHIGNDFPGYAAPQPLHGHNWVDLVVKERGHHPIADAHSMPVMCNHCDDAPCIKASQNGAMYKRPDGVVMLDPVKAKGQRQLVGSCPYGAIYWNEELNLPQKWCFDIHLIDRGWKRTRIEQSCATGALQSVKVSDEEMRRLVAEQKLRVLLPEAKTMPRVYYKNLHLMDRCFIGGTVISAVDGVEDCVEGARVSLSQGGKVIAESVTDVFGEFKFDDLAKDSGEYSVSVKAQSKKDQTIPVILSDSQYIGLISI